MTAALAPDACHVWLLDATSGDAPAEACEALLSDDERARRLRYQIPRSRLEYTLARGLVRTLLSRYAGFPPHAFIFRSNPYGRPEIEEPREARDLRFNVSHSRGLVACAVARGRDVGVDVEDGTRKGRTVEIADRFFSPREIADLHALPAEEQRSRFFEYWTLKEAYIKARGMGLAIPLRLFSFVLDGGAAPRIATEPELGDDGSSWQFVQFRPSGGHFGAVAIRRGSDAPLSVRVESATPLFAALKQGAR